ncbi:hypothetical protein Tco_1532934, partial [Tanacetum coccineum]
ISEESRSVTEHSESKTPNLKGDTTMEAKPTRSGIPRHRDSERETVFTRLGRKEKGVFNRLGGKGRSVSARSSESRTQRYRNIQRETEIRYQSSRPRKVKPIPKKRYHKETSSQRTKAFSESEDSGGGFWKLKVENKRKH